ncbi:hypothetical protein [Nonomuraea dietziae]|uniref:hypothetical protein n=1 Tax=Nonomuraea dietziae TaxID=65515 RepID=UPI003442EA50
MRVTLALVASAVFLLAIWAAVFPMRGGDELGGPNSQIGAQLSSDGTVFLSVRDIDLRARQATVSADLRLRLPDVDEEALGTMRVWSGATGVARSGITTQTVSTQIRLRDMYAVFAPLPDFKVPLTGSMTAYPHDRYSARFQIEITVSDGVELPPLPDGTKRMSPRTLMLFISTIKLDDNLSDWTLPRLGDNAHSYYVDTGGKVEGTRPGSNVVHRLRLDTAIQVDLTRRPNALAFVYAVLATPVLLVLALALRRQSKNTSPLELAAALLAVISLRQVLVPSDISGFTILDKVLGIEVAFITAVTLYAYAREH